MLVERMRRKQVAFAVLAASLFGLSYLACGSDGSGTERGTEIQTNLLGTWQGTAELEGETIPFSLALDHAPTKDAPERMGVVGSLTSENPKLDGDVDGSVALRPGSGADLSLRLSDGTVLLGSLSREALKDGRVLGPTRAGSFGLWRP